MAYSKSKGSERGAAIRAFAFLLGLWTGSVPALGGEPSEEYRAGLKRTLELRQRRRGNVRRQPVGAIFPYPMPPSLIIRHTPEVHDEIRDLLNVLRR